MAMADSLQYTQSVVFGLVVSFLLAKLFSLVFSSEDEDQSLTTAATNPNENQPELIPSETRLKLAKKYKRSDAEGSKKLISGGEKELFIDHQEKIAAYSSNNSSDDDWEGVETTELDEAFSSATAFLAATAVDRSSEKVPSDLKLNLYGLYKIATEGACNVPQPSAIKFTARAKWNAWHKLGAMSPEEAMQKYLEIVTERHPNWADGSTSFKRRSVDDNEKSYKDTRPMSPDFTSSMHDEESGNECKVDAIGNFAKEGDADDLLKCTKDDVGDVNDDDDGNYSCDLSHSDWHRIQA